MHSEAPPHLTHIQRLPIFQKLEAIHQKLDRKLDANLEAVHRKLEAINRKLNQKLEAISRKLETIERKLDSREGSMFPEFGRADSEVRDDNAEFKEGFVTMITGKGERILSGADEINWDHIKTVFCSRGLVVPDAAATIVGENVTANINGTVWTFLVASNGDMFFMRPTMFLIENYEDEASWTSGMYTNYFVL